MLWNIYFQLIRAPYKAVISVSDSRVTDAVIPVPPMVFRALYQVIQTQTLLQMVNQKVLPQFWQWPC